MKALVTGGGGFLGGAVVKQLLARGDHVRILARGNYPLLRTHGVETVQGDVADLAAVTEAARGCDIVFHVAAKAGLFGRPDEYDHANIEGTRCVIEACKSNGIQRLVFTSSPSVVYGGESIEGGDESLPFPEKYVADYPRTKAAAELLVRAANGSTLRTVSLRPHLIWGPGDTNLGPRMIARAKAGRLRKVGDGRALVDTIYIDNAAEAHLLAADRLTEGSPICGKAYFLSNGEPIAVGDMLDNILRAAGLQPEKRSIPAPLAVAVGGLMEMAWSLFHLKDEPPMTRFLAKQLSTAHWFNISAARRDLGYSPRVSINEGLERLAKSYAAG